MRTTKTKPSSDDQIIDEDTGWTPQDETEVVTQSKTDPTSWPAVSFILAMLLPPIGAVLGHISLRRTFWRQGLSWGAVVLGWTLTVVLTGGFLAWDGDRRAQEATEARVAAADAQTREMIESTESFGKLNAGFCEQLKVTANLIPQQGFVQSGADITPELIAAYAALGETETPHSQIYADYAEHLSEFDSTSNEEKAEIARSMVSASSDDVYACLPLVDERFADMQDQG